MYNGNNEDLLKIKEVLMRFQEGYHHRNSELAASFVDELYASDENVVVLGTGTGELFIGRDRIIELIQDDWNYWGDVTLEVEKPNVSFKDDIAWIAVQGSVKYSFEDTPARYDSYLNFIKQRLENTEVSEEQRFAFLNWALMLTYHQREDKKREYQWPLCLSGVLQKVGDKWRFVQQHFSLSVSDYPDERFEASGDHAEAFHKQNSLVSDFKGNQKQEADLLFLKDFEQKLFGLKTITDEALYKLFFDIENGLVIGVDLKEYQGIEAIKTYFQGYAHSKLSLSLDHSIVTKHKDVTWITVCGILEQDMKKEAQFDKAMQLLRNITESDSSAKDKIFLVQKRIAYLMKELSFGEHSTYPIRFSLVLDKADGLNKIRMLDLSHPSYWVFEGKL